MFPIRTILHPTDFTPDSQAAFALACSMARDYGARLILLHVWQAPVLAYGEMGMVVPTPADNGTEAQAALEQMKPADPSISVQRIFRKGAPGEEILAVANEVHPDLIVMGTHGRRGLRRLMMGSVAEEIVRKAPCPVLTAKGSVAVEAPIIPEAEPARA
jgi:nucleotide-binding universal stress UspA family protein